MSELDRFVYPRLRYISVAIPEFWQVLDTRNFWGMCLTGRTDDRTAMGWDPSWCSVQRGRPTCERTGMERGLALCLASCSRGGTFWRRGAVICLRPSLSHHGQPHNEWGSLCPDQHAARPGRNHTNLCGWLCDPLLFLDQGCQTAVPKIQAIRIKFCAYISAPSNCSLTHCKRVWFN